MKRSCNNTSLASIARIKSLLYFNLFRQKMRLLNMAKNFGRLSPRMMQRAPQYIYANEATRRLQENPLRLIINHGKKYPISTCVFCKSSGKNLVMIWKTCEKKNTCILFSVSKTNMEIDFSELSLKMAFPTETSLFSKCGFVFLHKKNLFPCVYFVRKIANPHPFSFHVWRLHGKLWDKMLPF